VRPPFKVPLNNVIVNIRKDLRRGLNFDVIVKKHLFGTCIGFLYDKIEYVHRFNLGDVYFWNELGTVDEEYLKILYTMEIVSASRIACLVKDIIKNDLEEKIIKLCKDGFSLVGTVFGSTGRFEATVDSSDFEYIFIYYPGDPSTEKRDPKLEKRLMRGYLRRTLNFVGTEINK